VGETLRRERVSRNLTVDEISRSTRISSRFLRAIEKEDFATLPGLIFARNFVRQYASSLGIDPEPLVAKLPRFDLESAPMPQPPNRPRKPLWDPRWNATMATATWTLLALGAAGAAYLHFNLKSFSHSAQTPGNIQTQKMQPQTATPKPAETAVAVSAVPAPAPAPPAVDTSALSGRAVQVVLAAKEESWVQAIADGKSVFIGMLKPGETRAIGADERVKVRTGNAGGIEISLNGKPIDPLGPSGQVRSVMLTAEGPQLPPAAPVAQTPPPVVSSPN
jgi:cytoskeletal protein RodZ